MESYDDDDDRDHQSAAAHNEASGSSDDPKSCDAQKFIKGSVKFYNKTKAFGFIEGDDGNDYFVHESCIVNPLSWEDRGLLDKQRVCFNPQIDTRSNKFRAVNVTIMDKEAVDHEKAQRATGKVISDTQSAAATQKLVADQFHKVFMAQQQQLMQMQAVQMSMHPAFQGFTPEHLQWTVVEQNAVAFREQANQLNPVLQQQMAAEQANQMGSFETMSGLHQAVHAQQVHMAGLQPAAVEQEAVAAPPPAFAPFLMTQKGSRNSIMSNIQEQHQQQSQTSKEMSDVTQQHMYAAMMQFVNAQQSLGSAAPK